jgi:hypothetical protein
VTGCEWHAGIEPIRDNGQFRLRAMLQTLRGSQVIDATLEACRAVILQDWERDETGQIRISELEIDPMARWLHWAEAALATLGHNVHTDDTRTIRDFCERMRRCLRELREHAEATGQTDGAEYIRRIGHV